MGTGMGIEEWGSVRNGVNDKQHYIVNAMETFCVFWANDKESFRIRIRI